MLTEQKPSCSATIYLKPALFTCLRAKYIHACLHLWTRVWVWVSVDPFLIQKIEIMAVWQNNLRVGTMRLTLH